MAQINEQAKAVIDIDGQLATEELVRLKKQSKDLRAEINKLYKVENVDVKNLAQKEKALGKINAQQRKLTNETKGVNKSMREMNGTVKKSNSLFRGLKSLLPVLGIGFLVTGFKKLTSVLNVAFGKFEERLDNLQALTGLSGDKLKYLGDEAKKTSVKVTEEGVRIKQSATDILDAYTKVGSKRPELLKNAEALASVTEKAIILSEAAKGDLEPAVEAVTASLNQFNLDSGETDRIINALAAGSQAGAADIPYLTEAIDKTGTTMKLMNVEFEEGIGIIEAVAPNFTKASLAGNSLDKVLLKMKENSIGYVDGTFNMNAAINQLKERFEAGESAASIFGVEHAKMVEVLISKQGDIDKYTQAVTGTNKAFEQAAINTDNNRAKFKRFKNQVNLLAVNLGERLAPSAADAAQGFGKLAGNVARWVAIKTSKKLQQEQIDLRVLESRITDTNIKQEDRVKLIKQLQDKYPAYLGNLDADKVTNEELKTALSNINDELIKKIQIQIALEEVEKRAHRAARVGNKLAQAQIDMENKMGEVNAKYQLNADLTNKSLSERIITIGKAIDIKKEEIKQSMDFQKSNQKEAALLNQLTIFKDSLFSSTYNLINLQKNATGKQKKLNEETDNYNSILENLGISILEVNELLGEQEEVTEEAGEGVEDMTIQGKKAYDDLLKRIKEINHEIELSHMEENERELQIIRDKYAKEIEAAEGHTKEIEQLRLLRKEELDYKIAEQNEKARIIEKDKEKEFQEKIAQYREEFSLLSMDELKQKELDKLDETYEDKLEKDELYYQLREAIIFKYNELEEEEDQKKWEEKLNKAIAYYNALNDIASGLLQSQIDLEYAYLDTEIANQKKALDKETKENLKRAKKEYDEKMKLAKGDAEKQAQIKADYEAQIMVIEEEAANEQIKIEEYQKEQEKQIKKDYADKEFAIKVANIIANNAQALTKIWADLGPIASSIATAAYLLIGAKQIDAANEQRKMVKQLATGKYDVIGVDDGKVYHAPYTSSLSTGLIKSPTLVGEEPEIVVDTATTRNIMMNYPAIFDAINYARVPQRAEGNISSTNIASSTLSEDSINQLNSAVIMLVAAINELNHQLDEGLGVNYDKWDKTMTDINRIKAEVTR